MTKPPREHARPRHKPHPSGVQGRSATARNWRRVYDELVNEWIGANYIGAAFTVDTVDLPSTEAGLIKRATSLRCRLDALDQRVADGEDIDDGHLVRLTGQLSRVMRALDLEATPTTQGNGKSSRAENVLQEMGFQRMPGESEAERVLRELELDTPEHRDTNFGAGARYDRYIENQERHKRGLEPLPDPTELELAEAVTAGRIDHTERVNAARENIQRDRGHRPLPPESDRIQRKREEDRDQ